MFLCLAYESVILSFFTFPPVLQIKDVSQLARAVEKGEYHCISPLPNFYLQQLESQQEKYRIIAKDIAKNNYRKVKDIYFEHFRTTKTQNFAMVLNKEMIPLLALQDDFVSEDYFFESMAAMKVRKGFCCKKLLDSFVHKMVASGLYSKYWKDYFFTFRLPLLFKYSKEYPSKRKLTITDVAPAFIFLLTGYLVSFLIFLGEVVLHHRKEMNFLRKRKKRNMRKTSALKIFCN